MSTTFPTSIQDLDATRGTTGQTLASPNHITQHTYEDDTIEALQTKVGVDSSAVATSLDYKVSNASSVNPGHKHTLAAALTDVNISAVSDGNVLVYNGSQSKWINTTTDAPDASTSVKGVARVSVAPASATVPISVGDNDPRVPTQSENDALAGTSGTPSSTNKFATEEDDRVEFSVTQAGSQVYAADAGANDTYVITLSPVPASYTTGMVIQFKANTANTGAATLNVNSLGAKTIVKDYNLTLANNDILANQLVSVIYDGTNFQLLSPVQKKYSSGDATSSFTSSQTVTVTTNFRPRRVRCISVTGSGSGNSDAYSDITYFSTTGNQNGIYRTFENNGSVIGFGIDTTNIVNSYLGTNQTATTATIGNFTDTGFDFVITRGTGTAPTVYWQAES